MSERVYSMPHHEELDATVIIKRDSTPDPNDAAGVRIDSEGGCDDELFADDSLDNTFFETQDVSAWLEESLFSAQRAEQVSICEAVISDTAPLKSEKTKMSELNDVFSDFESEAPEPPRPHQVFAKREPTDTPKARETNKKPSSEKPWQWKNTLESSKKLPLVAVSLIFLLAVGTLLTFNTMQLDTVEKGVEPPTLSLLKNVPVSEVELQSKQTSQSSEQRYCLSQGIKLGAAVERVAKLTRSVTANLQSQFIDFAQRCESYQFVPGVYLQTQLTGGEHSPDLESQNLVVEKISQPATAAMVDTTENKLTSTVSSQSVLSPQIIKNIQWRLVKLGFYKGRADGKSRIDGIYNTDTQVAVNAFYQKHNEFTMSESATEILNAIDSIYVKRQ